MLVVPLRAELRHRPLETPRLSLLPVEPNDATDLWNAVETSRAHLEKWLPWVPFNTDLDASWRYCEASANDWDHARALRFSIRERSSRRLLGVVGLEALAHLHKSAELGYWIRVAAATDNVPSLGVIRKLGFRYEGTAREAERCQGRWLDHALFALLSTDALPPA